MKVSAIVSEEGKRFGKWKKIASFEVRIHAIWFAQALSDKVGKTYRIDSPHGGIEYTEPKRGPRF